MLDIDELGQFEPGSADPDTNAPVSPTATAGQGLRTAFDFPRGFRLDPRVRAEMATRWNLFRPVAAGLTVIVGALLWALGFEQAWIAVALAVVVLLHALTNRARPEPAIALALDIPLTFLTLELIGVPTAVMAIVYVTYGVIATLLCRALPRVLLATLASVLFAGAALFDSPMSLASDTWRNVAGWIAAAIFLALLLATVAMTIDLLQRNIEDVDLANRELRALARSKDELIATVGHEIRTPLAAVLGFAAELQDGWDHFTPVEGGEMASLIVSESSRIADIVDDLIVATRADLGSLAIRLEPVSLHQTVHRLVGRYGGAGEPISVVGEDVEVEADPPRFRQVLRHLLVNAVTHGGDHVWVETGSASGTGYVRVCDNGEGVPEALRQDMFSPFVRGSDRVTQPQPFGLGLSVAGRLADAMGGSLTYQRRGEASVFELALRRVDPDDGQDLPDSSSAAAAPAGVEATR